MASNAASLSLKPRRGKAKTIPSVSITPASAAEETSDVAGKLESIMLRLEKLNVLDQLVVQVTNLTKSPVLPRSHRGAEAGERGADDASDRAGP